MSHAHEVDALIKLRRQTRKVSDLLRSQAADYLATVSPLIRPQFFFGEYLQGSPRSSGRETQHHFKEFRTLYDRISLTAPFNLVKELEIPLNLASNTPELFPLEYDITLQEGGQRVRITSPTRWVVGFAPFELARFRRLIKDPNRSNAELYRFLTHYLLLFYCISKSGGLGRLLKGLRFPLSFERLKDFGELPFCILNSPLKSNLPDESVIRSSTEVAGNATFEELVSHENIINMKDDIRQHLLEVADGV